MESGVDKWEQSEALAVDHEVAHDGVAVRCEALLHAGHRIRDRTQRRQRLLTECENKRRVGLDHLRSQRRPTWFAGGETH